MQDHSKSPQWEELATLIRAYCLARWQAEPLRVQFDLANLGSASLPMPSWEARIAVVEPFEPPKVQAAVAQPVEPSTAILKQPEIRRVPTYGDESCEVVTLMGVRYWLTPTQARVVKALKEAADEGVLDVSGDELLKAAGSDSVKLSDLFRRSAAWGNLIVSVHRGYYRLAGAALDLDPAG